MNQRQGTTLHLSGSDNAVMLAGFGVFAYTASMMTHEALGHGGFCVAVGGQNEMLTAWAERCNAIHHMPSGIEAAGPLTQFSAGLVAWLALRFLPSNVINLRTVVWLYMAFNLLIASGYVAYSGFTNFGDAAAVISGLAPPALWRAGLVVAGATIYYLSLWAAAFELKRFAGSDDSFRRLNRLVRIPYLSASIVACCAGALNRTMPPHVALGLAAASSFGAGSGLLALPGIARHFTGISATSSAYVSVNIGWICLAVLVGSIFLFVLGPGLERS